MLRCRIQLPWKEVIGLILFSIGTMATDGYTLDTGRHNVGCDTHRRNVSLGTGTVLNIVVFKKPLEIVASVFLIYICQHRCCSFFLVNMLRCWGSGQFGLKLSDFEPCCCLDCLKQRTVTLTASWIVSMPAPPVLNTL